MKINENKKSLKTATLIFIDFQYLSINCYWFLWTIIDVIDFDWMLLSGSTMYKYCNVLTVEAPVCPVMIDCSSRSAMTRSFSLFPSLSNTVSDSSLSRSLPNNSLPLSGLYDDNDSDNGFFDTDRTRKKPPLRRLKNIGMASEKLYQNQP